MTQLTAKASASLDGTIICPGDKSVSHRSLIFGALAKGKTTITGLLTGDDVLSTASALRQLGVTITAPETNAEGQYVAQQVVTVTGVGLGAFAEPGLPLDLGNSGTGARLLMGVVAGAGISAVFTGDASLSGRPMQRIMTPLSQMGATFTARDGDKLPLTVKGVRQPQSLDWQSTMASAQVKSAILLAGLTARGQTSVTEPVASRDHTERMLRHFGVDVATTTHSDNSYTASITGEASLTAADIIVPSDPSSAAFPVVAALITRNSTVTVTGVSINPYRFGLYQTLIDMGGDITIINERVEGGEPVADLICRSSQLKAITVPASRAASMIDEYPVLAVAAAFAEGVTHMPGIEELRVKETDRIALMEDSLQRGGVDITSTHDSMTVTGAPEQQGGMTIDAQHDHRIAMSCLVFGLASREPVTVTGCETINTSFPGFDHLMQSLGADIRADQIDADKKNHKGNT